MKPFDFYVNEGKVKRCSKDIDLVKSLVKDAVERKKILELLDINTMSKIMYENAYDVLRNILDALLLLDGYKSYSHEASIAYLKHFSVSDSIMVKIDMFRYARNSSKYYGKEVTVEMALDIQNFLPEFFSIIQAISPEIKELLLKK